MRTSFFRHGISAAGLVLCIAALAPASVAAAEASAPFAAAEAPPTGDQKRSYVFAETGATVPYRLYVPTSYDGSKALPLIVVLHGGGHDQDQPIDVSALREEAERRQFIVVSPLGYDRHGGYGTIYPFMVSREAADRAANVVHHDRATGRVSPLSASAAAPTDAVEFRPTDLTDPVMQRRSEQDVLNVMDIVLHNYRVDPDRIYIMGNSMGGLGAQYFGVKYAERFAGVVAAGSSTVIWAYPFERLRDNGVGILYLHGDGDEQAHSRWAEIVVDHATKMGVDAEMLLVKGSNHRSAWILGLADSLDFLLQRRKARGH